MTFYIHEDNLVISERPLSLQNLTPKTRAGGESWVDYSNPIQLSNQRANQIIMDNLT